MRLLLMVAALMCLAGTASAQDMKSQGAVLSLSCAACHGTDGNSPGSIPTLKGHGADHIRDRLQEFRSGKRPSTVMGRIAKGYTLAEIDAIAAHFAALNGGTSQ